MRRKLILVCFLFLPFLNLQAEWYRSDTLGRPVELLGSGDETDRMRQEQEEFLLFRKESPDGLTENLYRYGKVVRERRVQFLSDGRRQEIVLEGPERRLCIYEGMLPVREEIYLADALQRIIVYGWEGNRLKFLELSGGEGLLYRQEYHMDPLGRLRTLLQYSTESSDQMERGARIIQFSYTEGRLSETWVGDYNDGIRTRFAGLQALEETRITGTSVVSRIEREFDGESQIERSFAADGRLVSTIIRRPDGRTLRETLYLDGDSFRDREYQYQDNLLIAMVTREPERLERRSYIYLNDILHKEEVFVNRRLVKVSIFEGNQTLEEFYRRGQVIARRRYEGDTLVSEETYE